jgi:hypothetical protein
MAKVEPNDEEAKSFRREHKEAKVEQRENFPFFLDYSHRSATSDT